MIDRNFIRDLGLWYDNLGEPGHEFEWSDPLNLEHHIGDNIFSARTPMEVIGDGLKSTTEAVVKPAVEGLLGVSPMMAIVILLVVYLAFRKVTT